MGFFEKVGEAITPQFAPLRDAIGRVNQAIAPGGSPGPTPAAPTGPKAPAMPRPAPDPNAAQKAYEAKTRAMNTQNPHFKNVDNSGLTREPIAK